MLDFDTVTLDEERDELIIIDQTRLPNETVFLHLTKPQDVWDAIYTLKVRGAPAIGVAAAIGFYLAAKAIIETDFHTFYQKCKSIKEAFYYMARVIDEGLSKRELEDVIDNDDFSKYGNALTNFSSQLSTSQSLLAMNVLKDPYRLDFVTLERGYDEHDLESAIAKDITRFLLELGSGFTYVGRQPEFVVGNEGYFPDLLFYHIRLRCYVVIELKVVDFKPEFAGKLNFYVTACNKLLRQPEDNPTIGLLLCKSKDQTKVEWAFDSIQNPMGVATYEGIKIKDKLPSVEDLKKRLDMVEQELREYKENEEASAKEGNYTSNQETK